MRITGNFLALLAAFLFVIPALAASGVISGVDNHEAWVDWGFVALALSLTVSFGPFGRSSNV